MSDYKIRVDVGSDYSLAVESAKINNNLDDLKVKIIDVKKENDKNILTFSDGKRMVVKDGATPYIGDDGYWYIDGKPTKVKAMAIHSFNELTPDEKKELKGEPGKDGERGVDGKDGVDGVSIKITDTQTDKNGNTFVKFSDNTQIQIPKGEKGDKGAPFTRDDFTEEDWEDLKGEKGQSITIRESTQQKDGSTLVIFSDNTQITIPKGQKGDALKLDDLSDEDKKELLNSGLDLSEYAKIEDVDKKVDKETGKGLSTNDYSNEDKDKLQSIPELAEYTDTKYEAGDGLELEGLTFKINDTIARKEDIPNIDSALGEIDLSNYITTEKLQRDLDKKVDKVEGKKLSTNDYTNDDKQKLQSIPSEAKYTDTTYTAGNGLKLDSNIFSVDETVAMKEDIKNPYLVKKFSEVLENTLKKEKMEDDLGNWHQIPAGYYFASPNQIENQPSDYGLFRVITRPGEFSIIWEKMEYGSIYRKSGNRNLMSDWVEISFDTSKLSKYISKEELDKKVDKVEGKELSSNDYTDEDRQKLQAIPSEAKYTDTTYKAGEGLILNENTFSVDKNIPTKEDLNFKVDKEEGKILSSNDYTNEDKNKLQAIPKSAKYTDTTYQAGTGLELSNNTFKIDSTVARKSDIPDKIELTPEQKLELKGDRGEQGPRGLTGPKGELGPKGEDGKFDVSNITTYDIDKLTEKLYEPGKDYKSIEISTFEIKFYDATNNIQIRNTDRSRGKTLTIDLANGRTSWY